MKKASLIVADSEHSADMFYATGFRAPDPFIYFSCGSRKAMILSALEFDRGKTECHPGINIFRYEDFIKNGRRGMGDILRVLFLCGLRKFLKSSFCESTLHKALKNAKGSLSFCSRVNSASSIRPRLIRKGPGISVPKRILSAPICLTV